MCRKSSVVQFSKPLHPTISMAAWLSQSALPPGMVGPEGHKRDPSAFSTYDKVILMVKGENETVSKLKTKDENGHLNANK